MSQKNTKQIIKDISGENNFFAHLALKIRLLFNRHLAREYNELKFVWNDIEKFNPRKINTVYYEPKSLNWVAISKLAIAASVIIFAVLYTLLSPKTVVLKNNTCHPLVTQLPDQSTVTLDTGATLIYTIHKFKPFSRYVILKGQAYFQVVRRNNRPFIVNCHNLDVKVLGTKFNVLTNDFKTEVTLIEGKVQLFGFKTIDTSLILRPKEMVEYNVRKNTIKKQVTNPEIQTFWMQKTIHFNQFQLQDIAQIFKNYYGKTLIFDDTLLKYKHIGGSAPTDNWLLIVKALSYITHTKYIITNDTIYLKPIKN